MNISFSDRNLSSREEVRDFIQHYTITRLISAGLESNFLFRGGTMLRVCAFKGYRFSEDLDLEASQGHKKQIYAVMQEVAEELEKTNKDIVCELIRGSQGLASYIYCDTPKYDEIIILVDIETPNPKKQVTITTFPINPHYPDIGKKATVNCHSLQDVAASKFDCLGNRFKGRDLYDLWFLGTQHNLIAHAWKKYLETWQEYDSKIRPPNLASHIARNQKNFHAAWHEDIAKKFYDNSLSFDTAMNYTTTILQELASKTKAMM